ncbi:MAG: DMT family transporter [Clostridia bacterium]|nr:DMT family transporter [Clostridia bacterium]
MAIVPLRVLLALATAVVAVSFASIFVRFSSAPPVVLSFYRLALAVPLTVLASAAGTGIRGRTRAAGGAGVARAGRPAAARARWPAARDVALMAASGLLLALHFTSWIASLRYTTVASSLVLVSSHPLLVAAAAVPLGDEPLSRAAYLAAGVALLGTAIVGGGDYALGGTALYGDGLALLGAACLAGYMLVGRRLRSRLDNATYTTWVYAFAAVALGLGARVAGVPLVPYPPREWAIFLALAVVPTLFGHTLFNWALEHVPAATVSVTNLGEPVGATLLAWLVLGELPTAAEAAGGAAILAGLVGFLRATSKPPDAEGAGGLAVRGRRGSGRRPGRARGG